MGSEDVENGVEREERRSSITEKRHKRRKRRPRSDLQLQLPAYTNGHILFFLFSTLLFIAVMTNFVLFAYLPDHLVSETGRVDGENDSGAAAAAANASDEAQNPEVALENEYKTGIRGKHEMNRDLRPIDQESTTNDAGANVKGDEDQKEILRVLQQAGVTVDDATLASLPKWSDITSMYGPKPIIYGLDTCEQFQSTFKPEERFIGPAGIFNTGTNLLAELLKANCEIPGAAPEHPNTRDKTAPGMRFQVPWGKHNPVNSFRLHNVAITEGKQRIDQTAVLPVVTTKDPYGWFGSMCRHQYAARWPHRGHCPNLVLDDTERRMGGKDNGIDGGVPVTVGYGPTQRNMSHYDSLAGLWNEWYGDYFDITEYPRLIVRFEDVMISPKEVVTKVCECGGGVIKGEFKMVADAAKKGAAHKGSSGLVSALTRYGDPKKRVDGMEKADLDYARQHLRDDLMEAFGYHHPPPVAAR